MAKNIFASKTVQGLLAAAFGVLLPKLHIPLGDVDAQKLASDALSIAGIIWGLYGRATVPGSALRIGSAVLAAISANVSHADASVEIVSPPPSPASPAPMSSSASGPAEAIPTTPVEAPTVVEAPNA